MDKKIKLQDHIFKGIARTIPVIVLFSLVLAMGEWNDFFVDFSGYIYLTIIPVLAINIVYSMHKFEYLLPVAFVGYIAYLGGTGLLGGILVGILFGISIGYVKKNLFENRPISILYVFLINIVLGILMYLVVQYLVIPPISFLLESLFNYLQGIDKTNVMYLVAILSILTVVDLGGPINKVAFAFNIESFLNGYYNIVGPVLISVTVPVLSIYIGMHIYINRFSVEDKSMKKFALLSSIVGMTEGAMAVGFRRVRIIPILVLGGLTGSMFAAYFGLESNMLLAAIPGLLGTSNVVIYIASHLIGTTVCLLLFLIVLRKEEIPSMDKIE